MDVSDAGYCDDKGASDLALTQQMGVVIDAKASTYVREIGRRLAEHSHQQAERGDHELSLLLVDDPAMQKINQQWRY